MGKVSDFFEKFGPIAVEVCAGTGIFPSVALGQAALETGYAEKKPYNNMFGRKAANGDSPVFSATTHEVIDGKDVVFKGTGKVYNSKDEALKAGANKHTIFKTYPTMKDSWKDYVKLLTTSSRYAKAREAENPFAQIQAIKAAGYATSTSYVDKVSNIIRSNNLQDWDQKKKSSRVGGKNRKWIVAVVLVVVAVIVAVVIWKRKEIFGKLKNIKLLKSK